MLILGRPVWHDQRVRSTGRALLRFPTTPGLIVAAVFWWFSLVPSLLPRSALIQGVVSAICVGIGYMLGLLGAWIVRSAARRRSFGSLRNRLPDGVPMWWVGGGATIVLVVVGSIMWVRWQNQQRPLVAMESVSALSVVPM